VGQERLGPSYFFISLVLGPLNNLFCYVPSSAARVHIYIYLHIFARARKRERERERERERDVNICIRSHIFCTFNLLYPSLFVFVY